ncbi:MAG: TetR/AcrR family transcriptional regulator [Ectothiorhodospiraceae bacterium]|nr:TetR/AcrR family transcriptional regulator [Ectothiorhodospiraceae bacterium]MCH8506312.1 TetR/AcrR family transcriptional regulator [Ectothiorhodospiraceae bacterium]
MPGQFRGQVRRRRILEAALEIFTERGVADATIAAICERAGASIGSVYHHFGNKEGIAAALYEQGLEEHFDRMLSGLEGAGRTGARESVAVLVGTFMDWCLENPEWARFILLMRSGLMHGPEGERFASVNRERLDILRGYLMRFVQGGELRALPEELYLPLLHGPAQLYIRAWMAGRVPAPTPAHRAALIDAAWRAVGVEDRERGGSASPRR